MQQRAAGEALPRNFARRDRLATEPPLPPNNSFVFNRGQAIFPDGFSRAMFVDSCAVQFIRVKATRSRD
jgi:hypothetical protein